MMTIPDTAVPYFRTVEFSEGTLPSALLHEHRTKPGVWARICVSEGKVRYRILDDDNPPEILTPKCDGIVAPEVTHRLELEGPVRLYIEFMQEPDAGDTDDPHA
jgi:tellurite resistance-related uncharacterized protein